MILTVRSKNFFHYYTFHPLHYELSHGALKSAKKSEIWGGRTICFKNQRFLKHFSNRAARKGHVNSEKKGK